MKKEKIENLLIFIVIAVLCTLIGFGLKKITSIKIIDNIKTQIVSDIEDAKSSIYNLNECDVDCSKKTSQPMIIALTKNKTFSTIITFCFGVITLFRLLMLFANLNPETFLVTDMLPSMLLILLSFKWEEIIHFITSL